MEATHNFYDNQELAFATDLELKEITSKYVKLQKAHLKLKS